MVFRPTWVGDAFTYLFTIWNSLINVDEIELVKSCIMRSSERRIEELVCFRMNPRKRGNRIDIYPSFMKNLKYEMPLTTRI